MDGNAQVNEGPRIGPAAVAIGIVVPGALLWRQGKCRRAGHIIFMYISAIVVAVMSWGTWIAGLMCAAAFAVHAFAIVDAVRGMSFPGFARGVPATSIALTLALGVYCPAFSTVSDRAEAQSIGPGSDTRYVLDRAAYRGASPHVGEWIGYRSVRTARVEIGRVLGRSGDEVTFDGRVLVVGGSRLDWQPQSIGGMAAFRLTVPDGFNLVLPLSNGDDSRGLMLVHADDVIGRPWAQVAPVHRMRLL